MQRHKMNFLFSRRHILIFLMACLFFLFIFFTTLPHPARAAECISCPAVFGTKTADTSGLINPLGDVTFEGFIGRLIKIMLGLSGSIALLMFVYGGFLYLSSAGDDAKVKKGKAAIVNAVIGIFLVFFAYTFVAAVIKALSTGSV